MSYTDSELQAILDYCEAASRSPWRGEWINAGPGWDIEDGGGETIAKNMDEQDVVFVARARIDLPAVAKELMEARGLLQRWLEGLDCGVVFKLPDDTRAFLAEHEEG